MTRRLSCGGMGIWFLTARRRWSIPSMDMSNGEAARGSSTRRPQWTLIGWPMAITFDGLAPPANHIRVTLDHEALVPKVIDFGIAKPTEWKSFLVAIPPA